MDLLEEEKEIQGNEISRSGYILAVDDNPDNLDLLRRMLNRRGCDVHMVTNGPDALAAVRAQQPELILLDISMPGMNGYEVSRILKGDSKTRDVPIIFISALDDIESKLKAFTSGGVDYITKPFHSKEVIARVLTHLTLRSVQKELTLEKKYLEATGNAISDIVILTDCDGRITRANNALYKRLMVNRDEVIGKPYQDFFMDIVQVDLSTAEKEALPLLEKREIYIARSAGWFEVSSHPIWVGDSLGGYVFTFKEITAYKEAELHERQAREFAEAIQEAGAVINSSLCIEEVLDSILDQIQQVIPHVSSNIIMVEGDQGRVIRMHGYKTYGRVVERQVAEVVFDLRMTSTLKQMLDTGMPYSVADTRAFEGWQVDKTSEEIRSWLGAPIIASSRVIAFITLDHTQVNFFTQEHAQRLAIFAAQASMALQNARLYEEVNRMATIDFLTGLYNRRHFFTLAELEVQRVKENGGWLGLIMFDLDHLKDINTRFGHIVGGQSLQAVGRLCRELLPGEYIMAVYGGDEFVIMIPGGTREDLARVAEAFRQQVEATPIHTYRGAINITVSLGVAAVECQPALTLETLIDYADQALYTAKNRGRNSVGIWTEECIT